MLNYFPSATVWDAVHLLTGAHVAIKEEMPQSDEDESILPYEMQVYKLLKGHQGIPQIHYTGMYGGAHIIVMDKLGVTLQQLRRFCRGTFSLKTVLMLAQQLVCTQHNTCPSILSMYLAHPDRVCSFARTYHSRPQTRKLRNGHAQIAECCAPF